MVVHVSCGNANASRSIAPTRFTPSTLAVKLLISTQRRVSASMSPRRARTVARTASSRWSFPIGFGRGIFPAMAKRFKAAIIGGSGYGGAEMARRLLMHPDVELVRVASIDHVG